MKGAPGAAFLGVISIPCSAPAHRARVSGERTDAEIDNTSIPLLALLGPEHVA